ncbi:MAG: hypothetical protein B7X77_08070 [Caulobacter sp. 39-67-4]|nr:MAG: hypothetical protein B7X77_08070 [Caulobacter sp. 39-67-4]
MEERSYSSSKVDAIDAELARQFPAVALAPELEAEYERRTDESRRATIVLWMFGTMLANIACLPLDYTVDNLDIGLVLRLGVTTPVYIAAMLVLRRGIARAKSAAVILPLVVFVSVVSFLGLQAPAPHNDRYLMAAGLISKAASWASCSARAKGW